MNVLALRASRDDAAASLPWSVAGSQQRLAACLAHLVQWGAADRPHELSTFLEHMLGTWRGLTAWGLPAAVCDAGLFHSIYGAQTVDAHAVPLQQRTGLVRLVGRPAEQLVYWFSILDRRCLYDELAGTRRLASSFDVPVRTTAGLRTVRMPVEDVANLIAIDAANLAEQSRAPDFSPDIWMWTPAQAARRLARAGIGVALPLARWTMTQAAETAAREAYMAALPCIQTDPAGAARLLQAASTANRFVAEPLLALAFLHRMAGNTDQARQHARRGLARLQCLATAWDKRSPFETWAAFGRAMQAARPRRERRS